MAGRSGTLDFMKRLLIIAAICSGLLAGAAQAGVGGKADIFQHAEPAPAATTVRAMIERCLPGIVRSGPLRTAGLVPAAPDVTAQMLGRYKGTVWINPPESDHGDVLLIHLEDIDVCRVVAPTLNPRALRGFVEDVFRGEAAAFHEKIFAPGKGGAFRALYAPERTGDARIRVSAKPRGGDRAGYAIFTVLEN